MQTQNKDKFKKQAKVGGFNLETGFLPLGFILENLGPSQIAYQFIVESNLWLKNNFGSSIVAFQEVNVPPCVNPNFAKYPIRDIVSFEGHLIATNFHTAMAMKSVFKSKKYYYITDLEWLRGNFKYRNYLEQILKDDNIIKFTRSEDYYDHLVKNNIRVVDNIVDNFEIDKILEIVKNVKN